LIVYLPPEALEQSAAALANDPEGSGNTYQLIVTGPFDDEPHAANAITAAAAIKPVRPALARAPIALRDSLLATGSYLPLRGLDPNLV
jgi:hypothetical protein